MGKTIQTTNLGKKGRYGMRLHLSIPEAAQLSQILDHVFGHERRPKIPCLGGAGHVSCLFSGDQVCDRGLNARKVLFKP